MTDPDQRYHVTLFPTAVPLLRPCPLPEPPFSPASWEILMEGLRDAATSKIEHEPAPIKLMFKDERELHRQIDMWW